MPNASQKQTDPVLHQNPELEASMLAKETPTQANGPERALVATFLAVIAAVMVIQCIAEWRGGERPRIPNILGQLPTSVNLRAYEHSLEDTSVIARALRPWFQFIQFTLFGDGGERALLGRDSWLFYRPGYDDMVARNSSLPQEQQDPIVAITAFRDALAERGIRLLVIPAPNKESTYPDMLSRRTWNLRSVTTPVTRKLLDDLHTAGIETVNLLEAFAAARAADRGRGPGDDPLYLTQDSHWSPRGVALAAEKIAGRLRQLGWVRKGSRAYREETVATSRLGDVARMLQAAPIQDRLKPEHVLCKRVVNVETGKPYQDESNSEVLILGDSFLRVYQQDEPGSAGLIAHLAKELRQPLTSLISDGGASTLVRQELYRRPALLHNKKVVIWEFVERDIRLGTEGWQTVPLPLAAKSSAGNDPTPP